MFKGEEKAKKKKSSKKKKIVREGLSSANGGEAVVCGAANVSGSTQQLDAVEVAPNHDVSRGDGLARSDNNPEKSEGPKIMSGEGLITTSATVVSGHNRTAFKTELRVGDAILARTQTGTEEMRVITMVLSQVSISISSAFSTNISTPTAFRYINKPRNDKKEKAIKAEKARQEKEEVEERAMGTYGNKGEIIYREKTEHGGYRIRKEQATKKMSRSDLLSVRATKKSDRYC